MIDTPQITQIPSRSTAVIRLTVARSEIQNVMGPAIGEVMGAVAAQGIAPIGAVFTHHFSISPEFFDFEVGVPVASPVTESGRVKPSDWPGMTVAKTTYFGPYEGLGSAWGEFDSWIKANGHTAATDLWESYATGPESGSDSSKWRTEFVRALID